jgi:hypothetical protein
MDHRAAVPLDFERYLIATHVTQRLSFNFMAGLEKVFCAIYKSE